MNKKLMIAYARKLMDGKSVADKDFDMTQCHLFFEKGGFVNKDNISGYERSN